MNEVARKSAVIGETGYERLANDGYMTEPPAIEALLSCTTLRGKVWEPACGTGNIDKACKSHGYDTYASDIADYGYGQSGLDFLQAIGLPPGVETIITNPPFKDGLAAKFVLKALELLKPVRGNVWVLQRVDWDCGRNRHLKQHLFDWPYDGKLQTTWRLQWAGNKKKNPRFNYAWFHWDWMKPEFDAPSIGYLFRPK